jgi:hypothetical protein
MSGRPRLRAGLPRLFSDHSGARGRMYHKIGVALVAELGIQRGDALLLLQVGRVAALWVEYLSASRDLDAARRAREAGRGRRPSAAAVDRLAHRAKVASDGYAEALSQLKSDPLTVQRQAEAAAEAARARYRQSRPSAAPVSPSQPAQAAPTAERTEATA